jgi:hypothetical protein|tara:strand:+ start:5319 stop:6746 length:1428 start_codon:yes stop_codon:yes gene_type:complete
MRGRFRREYGSKLFALFIVIIMITVVYPVIINNANNPSQLSVYDDDWNDISQFASDLDAEEKGKHKIKTIVSRPSIISKISEVEKNTTKPTLLNNQTILVIIGVERMYNEYDSEALHDFVKSGGKVVIADDTGYGNTAFHGQAGALEIDVKLRTNKVQSGCVPEVSTTLTSNVLEKMGYNGGGSSDPKCKPAQLYDFNHWGEDIHTKNASTVIIDASIERMDFNGQLMMSAPGALTIKQGGKAEGLAWSSQEAFIDYNQDGEGGAGEGTYRENSTRGVEVISEANIGEGKVIFISDTSIFTNRYYEQLDNKEFITKLFEYLSENKVQTIIFDESRHIQSDFISLIYVQLFGILGHISSSEVLGMILLGSIIFLMQIIMMRVENPTVWRHLFNIYEGRLSRFRVPHAHYTHPETIKEVFIDKVRIDNGFTREEFGMLASSKIEELLKDPILIRFIINNEKNLTLKQVEKAIKGWKK